MPLPIGGPLSDTPLVNTIDPTSVGTLLVPLPTDVPPAISIGCVTLGQRANDFFRVLVPSRSPQWHPSLSLLVRRCSCRFFPPRH